MIDDKCKHCGVRVVPKYYSVDHINWIHQPEGYGSVHNTFAYEYCKKDIAEPVDEDPIEPVDEDNFVKEAMQNNPYKTKFEHDNKIGVDHGDLVEVVILTKDNIKEVAKISGRSEQDLRDSMSHSNVMNRFSAIIFRLFS